MYVIHLFSVSVCVGIYNECCVYVIHLFSVSVCVQDAKGFAADLLNFIGTNAQVQSSLSAHAPLTLSLDLCSLKREQDTMSTYLF